MPTFTYPGVYIEEIPSGVQTITGVATSIAAFVGWADQGPTNAATLVQSWSDFVNQFGGWDSRSLLGYAVNQFFANRGQQAYIVRLAADGNDNTIPAGTATVNVTDSSGNTFLTLQAANPGNWATSYGIAIKPRSDNPSRFSLSVVTPAGSSYQVVEAFQNLSLSSADPLYVVNVINSDSNYVSFPSPTYTPPVPVLPASIPTTPFMLAPPTQTIYLQDQNSFTYLAFQVKSATTWPANFAVAVRQPTNAKAGNFDLEVVYNPATAVGGVTLPITVESLPSLSVNPADPNYLVTVINATSKFVTVPSQYTPPTSTTLSLPPAFPATAATGLVALADTGSVSVKDQSATPVTFLQLQAANLANWPAQIGTLARADGTGFDLEVVYNPSSGAVGNVTLPIVLEQFPSLTFKTPNIASSQFLAASPSFTQPSPLPTLTLPASYPPVVTMAASLDGSVLSPNTAAFENKMLDVHGDGTHGVFYLEKVNIFNLLCVPGESAFQPSSASVLSTLQGFCVSQRAFLIVDCDQNDTFSTLQKQNGPSTVLTGVNSINSAFYFPWVLAPDPLQQNRIRPFPPCGFVAGLYAATDAARNVWKAPAGIEASLTGASGLTTILTDPQNGTLNPLAVNCLRSFRVYGNVIWGARTLQGNDQVGSQWKYVPIRRFALFLESSLYEGTQWVVFEPNDETLWGQIRLNVGSFMQGLFLQGAFQGTTPQQAYFVKCDSENNPQSSIDLGIVTVLVGFAPLYPAEFVVIQIQQMVAQS
jgi:uncharacterized protein